MSEIAGKLSVQAGARFLEKSSGGMGILLGGAAGVAPARVLVIGGGVVGQNAAQVALGMGAEVLILDASAERVRYLNEKYSESIKCLLSGHDTIERYSQTADLIIGAVLSPGAGAPKVVTRETLKIMRPGTVIVDVAIDQGGCFETSRPTTHEDPVFLVEGVLHYCVANIPGAVPKTSTFALNKVTLPYITKLATLGLEGAFSEMSGFSDGLNIFKGQVTHNAVADHLKLPYVNWVSAIREG
jgi:alanine dehydrogenase